MSPKVGLAWRFINYWLYKVNEHSLHSPFVYQFYTEIILADTPPQQFEAIETYRKLLLEDRNPIRSQDYGAGSTVWKPGTTPTKIIAASSLCTPKFGHLLYNISRYCQGKSIIELGTSFGISTQYLAAAVEEGTTIYTFEGNDDIAAKAKEGFLKTAASKAIQLISGDINQKLPELLSAIDSVSIAYIDANHRYEPTLHYFELLLAKCTENSILVFDDIHWSDEMHAAWQEITCRPEVSVSMDIFDAGIVCLKPLKLKQHYILSF